MDVRLKPLVWIGDSRKSLLKFPEEVLHDFGVALMYAQAGDKHQNAKPLKGFVGAGVLEVVEDLQAILIEPSIPLSWKMLFMLYMPSKRNQNRA